MFQTHPPLWCGTYQLLPFCVLSFWLHFQMNGIYLLASKLPRGMGNDRQRGDFFVKLLVLLPVSGEEQGYVCRTWYYSCRSFHSASRITYLSKERVKPVPLHLIIRCTLMESMQLVPICGSLFYVVVWGFFLLLWVKLRMSFHAVAAVRRSCPDLLPVTCHTLPSTSLFPALRLVGPLSNLLHLIKQANNHLLPRLILCWNREQAWFTKGSGEHWQQQEGRMGAGFLFG